MRKFKFIYLIVFTFLVSCQEEYYFDGGLADGHLNMTTYDFLSSRPDQFKNLVWLIEQNDLIDSINTTNSTFFAPQDGSIEKYLVEMELDEYQFEKLPPEVVEEMGRLIKGYIIPKKLPRAEIVPEGTTYKNFLDKDVMVSFQENPYRGVPGYGPKYVLFTSYSLFTDPDTGESEEIKQTSLVLTSDLISTNGIVHVLRASSHVFGF